jgi:hypothetical protein
MMEMILLFLFHSCKKFDLIFKLYSICVSGDQSTLIASRIKLSQALIFNLIFEAGLFDLGSTHLLSESDSVMGNLAIYFQFPHN